MLSTVVKNGDNGSGDYSDDNSGDPPVESEGKNISERLFEQLLARWIALAGQRFREFSATCTKLRETHPD